MRSAARAQAWNRPRRSATVPRMRCGRGARSAELARAGGSRLRALVQGAGLALLVACGERVVRAHDESGALRSEGHEVRGADGVWRRDGAFRAWHADGSLAEEGAFQDDLPSGRWSTWHPGGAPRSRGSYLFGEKEGVWVERLADGTLDERLSGIYEAGERTGDALIDGLQTDWFAPDEPRERATYADGLRDGLATTWYPGGQKRSEGSYRAGRRTGRWTYWHPDGALDERQSGTYDGWRRIGD